jgi:hypothetical protein
MTGLTMQMGVVLPGGTAGQQLEQAMLAEEAGWDGAQPRHRGVPGG